MQDRHFSARTLEDRLRELCIKRDSVLDLLSDQKRPLNLVLLFCSRGYRTTEMRNKSQLVRELASLNAAIQDVREQLFSQLFLDFLREGLALLSDDQLVY